MHVITFRQLMQVIMIHDVIHVQPLNDDVTTALSEVNALDAKFLTHRAETANQENPDISIF